MISPMFKTVVRRIGIVVVLCVLVLFIVGTIQANAATTPYTSGCRSHQNIWKASEGGITIGHMTITATECWGPYGHLTTGTKIAESYDKSTEAQQLNYNYKFQKDGADQLVSSSNDVKDWNTFGRAQLCTYFKFYTQCAFNEQFVTGITIWSPVKMKAWCQELNASSCPIYHAIWWGEPVQRYANEKGYHLDWTDEGTPT